MIWGQVIYSVFVCEQHLEVHVKKSTPTDYPISIICSDYVYAYIHGMQYIHMPNVCNNN